MRDLEFDKQYQEVLEIKRSTNARYHQMKAEREDTLKKMDLMD